MTSLKNTAFTETPAAKVHVSQMQDTANKDVVYETYINFDLV